MSSTFSAQLNHGLTTTETLSGSDLAAQSILVHSGFTEVLTLTSLTTPDVDGVAYQTYALSGGAISIDFTSIQLNGNAQNFTGKKLRYLKIKNMSASNPMTVAKGASNGFTGLGGSFSVTLPVGGSFSFYDGGNGSAVGSGSKTLDVTGTGTDTFQVSAADGD